MLQGHKEYDLFDTVEMIYIIQNHKAPDIIIKQRGLLFSSIWNGFENLTQDIVLLQKHKKRYHRYVYLYGICKILTPCRMVLFEKSIFESYKMYPVAKIYGEHKPAARKRAPVKRN